MNLDIAWSAPTPVPNCGYKALYRRKADPSYTEVDTSGTTLTISVAAPGSYEGVVVCDCCSERASKGVPFGVNAYQLLSVSGAIANSRLILTITSSYGNPYDTSVNGNATINVNGSSTVIVPFSVVYIANNVIQNFDLGNHPGINVPTSVITSIAPIFDKGGQLQQLDAVTTPSYFKFYYSGEISGNTWNGSPASLPSFTLDQFSPTELAVDGSTVLAGRLLFSYILHEVFVNVYGNFTIEVFDPSNNALVGSVILSKTPLGLREESIILTKSVSPLNSTTGFIMKVLWPDDTIFDTKQFYLPSF